MGKLLEGLAEDLTVYVRQRAWLNTAPEPPDDEKSRNRSRKPAKSVTRLAALKDTHGEDYDPPMPDVEAAFLLEYLFAIGPASVTGFGEAPIAFSEIRAWSEMTGFALSSWEVRTIARLSRAYVIESVRARKHDAAAPWEAFGADALLTAAERRRIAASMRESIEALKKL